MEEFHDIVNGGPTGSTLVFPAVDAKERFAMLGLRGPGDRQTFAATVMNWNVGEAAQRQRQTFDPATLATLNPKTRTLTSFRCPEELEIALDIHRR